VFAFGDVNAMGGSTGDFGSLLGKVTTAAHSLNQFAIAVTQKLCFYANSASCTQTDPEFRRVPGRSPRVQLPDAHQGVLCVASRDRRRGYANVRQGDRAGGHSRGVITSAALSNRLASGHLCARGDAATAAQTATASIAGGVVADTFSRGSQTPSFGGSQPVLPAAVEELCQRSRAGGRRDEQERLDE